MSAQKGAAEPEYIRQSGEVMTDDEARAWYIHCAEEARLEGMTHGRYSYHPDIPNLRIVEAWRLRPEDEGQIRWALTAEPSPKAAGDRS